MASRFGIESLNDGANTGHSLMFIFHRLLIYQLFSFVSFYYVQVLSSVDPVRFMIVF